MGALWLCLLAVLSGSGACSDCDISLAGQASVPEFCLSAQAEEAAQSFSGVLNFTLAENGSLMFEPLPPARKVSVEVKSDNNANGLKNWAKLANSFIGSVWSGSLPYNLIVPVINSSVDSPIATAKCMSDLDEQHTSNGNFEFRDILRDFGQWWAHLLIVTALGPLFALLLLITGCCFCFCWHCGTYKCRDRDQRRSMHQNRNDKRCVIFCIALFCCIQVLFVGISFSFVFNDQVNESVQNFDSTVNTALKSSLDFVDDAQMQATATVNRYEEINTFLQCQVDNLHITIGRVVLDVFEDAVVALINSSLKLAFDHKKSINSLQLVNLTVVKLKDLTQRLQTELDDLVVMLQTLDADCRNASLGRNCNFIPTESWTVVNYTLVDDVTAVLNQLVLIGDITEEVIEANATFYGIPCDIRSQIQNQAQEILDQADDFQDTIEDIANDTGNTLIDVLNEEGFVGDIRTKAHDIQEIFDMYNTPRYYISILICSLTLIVIMILLVGLLLGAIGFRCKTEQFERRKKLNCCGVALIYICIPFILILACILLFLASITFFLGANMLKVCYSIAEDPPNDDIPSYELYSKIVDNSELWGGYLLGCFLLDDSSIPLTVADMLNGCKSNQSIYQVAQLRRRPSLNLRDAINITYQIPDLNQLFVDLEKSIEFNLDQILTQETRDNLNSFANAGLQSVDYAAYSTYIDQITSRISILAIDSTISGLKAVHNGFAGFSHAALANDSQDIINEIIRINKTTIVKISNYTELLEKQIMMLNETSLLLDERVQGTLDEAIAIFMQLSGPTGSQLVINQTRRVLDYFIVYATDFANWAVNNLENEIGRCRPLYTTYTNLYYEVCEDAVDGINGLWFSTGFCALLFIPTFIFAVFVSCYLHVKHVVVPADDDYFVRDDDDDDDDDDDAPQNELPINNTENAWMFTALGSLPLHWDQQPIGADGKPERCHLVTLVKDSKEYNSALQKFQDTLPPSLCTIVAVKRIQNPQLYQQYNTMKAAMKGNIPDNCQLERELFHGTTVENCSKINHQGFNRIFAGKNAAAYGKGVYFAVHAGYSSQEKYSPRDENSTKYIYSCLVLTGEYTTGNPSMAVPPAKFPRQNSSILFESLVDNERDPTIFVAVKDGQAYPQYLIIFKMIY